MLMEHTVLLPMLNKSQLSRSLVSELSYPHSFRTPVQAVTKGPAQNFGLKAPTPGFGYEWTRSITEEQPSQIHDAHLAAVTKFDKFSKLH